MLILLMSDGSVPINSENSLSQGWFHNLQILKKVRNFSFSNNFLIVVAAKVVFRCKLLVFCLFNMLAMRLCLHGTMQTCTKAILSESPRVLESLYPLLAPQHSLWNHECSGNMSREHRQPQ